ncbi:unnamed protein product [Phytomonas sp. Hart1]|nr:unnamed protein product [Phytomonas sp. Hart1]|eukprot:CCW71012.1 unnamed protein product [Phytomonas sp. isolate Hart1]
MNDIDDVTQNSSINIQLSVENEVFIKVPQSEPRCSAKVVVQSASGSEARVECLGAPLFVDVSYYLIPGEQVALFSWTNAVILIEGSDLLLRNVFRTSIRSLNRAIIEYHSFLHEVRAESEKSLIEGPITLLCGRDDSIKLSTAKTLCNYATRTGWKPLLVDLDCRRSPILGIPGSVSASVVEFPITLDEVFSHTHVSITFFVGTTEPQHQAEDKMLSPSYVHYSRFLLSCCNDRLTKHQSNIFGWSGMIVIVPELMDNAAVNFITDIVEAHNVSHILTFGDDYLFHKLHIQYLTRVGLHGRSKVQVDRISKGHSHIPLPPLEQMLPGIFHSYFHGSGPIIFQPSQWLKSFETIEILRFKESTDQVQLITVEKDELQGIVGCIGALFHFDKIGTPLNSVPFAYVRVHSIEPTGVFLLTTTPFTFPSDRLTLVIGTVRWITST